MKKILTILFILLSVKGYSQSTTPQFLGGKNSNLVVQSVFNMADSPKASFNLLLPDTTTAKTYFSGNLKGRWARENGRLMYNATGFKSVLADSVTGGGTATVDSNLFSTVTRLKDTAAALRLLIGTGGIDTTSISNRIEARVKYTDTTAMLANYLNSGDIGVSVQGYNASTTILGNTTSGSGSTILLQGSPTITLPNIAAINVSGGILSLPTGASGTLMRLADTSTLSTRINNKLNISDTATMLSPYLRKADTTAMLLPYLRDVDTAAMLANYSTRINAKLNITDTANIRLRPIAGTNMTISGTYPNLTFDASGGGGGGDVTGGASSTDNAVAVYNGTTGKVIKNSAIITDASGNIRANNFVGGYTTTVTAAGTTTLTASSTILQFFTGVTTQTVVLPVTSTLTLGHPFTIVNNSTGLVTVNSSGANNVVILGAGTTAYITCILTSGTTAASWSVDYSGAVVATGKKATFNNTMTFAGTDAQTYTFPAASTTVGGLGTTQTWTGANTFNNANVLAGAATMALFNTTATNISFAGAATTFAAGGTPTTGLTATYFGNATASGQTKTLNFGTGGASGSTTAINIGSATSGATNNIKLNVLPVSDATGDIWYRNASGFMTRLGIGSTGQVLTVASGLPSWATSSGGGWGLTGNSGTTAGTNFVGTTDAQDLWFKRNGVIGGYISSTSTAFGLEATFTYQGASNVTAIGQGALRANLQNNNTATGTDAARSNTTGGNNTVAGMTALYSNTTASGSCAFGKGAGLQSNGDNNIFVGMDAGFAATSASKSIVISTSGELPSNTTANQVNIGNVIWASGASGTGTTAAGSVSIGTNTPNASAIFELASTTKGLLLPRMTDAQVRAITSPVAGLTVYNTDINQICFYNGTAWQKVTNTAM